MADQDLLDALVAMLAYHLDALPDGSFSTRPVLANVRAIRLLVKHGRAEVVHESTQILVVRFTVCRHGVPVEWNCNGCSDTAAASSVKGGPAA